MSLVLLVVLAARHGELESASGSLLSLPRDLIGRPAEGAAPAEVAFRSTDRPARVS